MRPDLTIEKAFLDHSKPAFDTVVDRLVKRGHTEIVVVPLLLTEAYHAKVDVPEAIAGAGSRHPGLTIRATSILGPRALLPRGARHPDARCPPGRPGA